MTNLQTEVKAEFVSLEEAAEQLGITYAGLHHWLKRNPDIKRDYCFKAKDTGRRKTVIRIEGIVTIATLRGQNSKNDKMVTFREGKKKMAEVAIEKSKELPLRQMMMAMMEQMKQMQAQIDGKPKPDILKLEEPTEEEMDQLPKKDYRAKLVQRMRTVARENGIEHYMVWGKLYEEIYYRFGMNLRALATKRGVKPLDVLAEKKMLKDTWLLACEVFPL